MKPIHSPCPSRLFSFRSASVMAMVLGSLLLASCSGFREQSGKRSSLVEFLYPDTSQPLETVTTPQLTLPLRAGLAFTPPAPFAHDDFTEVEKAALAEQVRSEFAALEFVDTIQTIPTDYLRPGGGFTNLDQLRQLFGVDVIVLLSYDQSRFTSENVASLAYWTIVGAYVIPGEKNATHTLIDAAVYDIGSRSLLFRAPGSSIVKSRSTLVANSEQVREDSVGGFHTAGENLVANLDTELARFQDRVKASPQNFQVTTRPGYTGAGSNGLILPVTLAVIVLLTGILRSGITAGRHNKFQC